MRCSLSIMCLQLSARGRPSAMAAVPRPAAAAGTPLTVIGWGVARDDWASYNPTVLQQVGSLGTDSQLD